MRFVWWIEMADLLLMHKESMLHIETLDRLKPFEGSTLCVPVAFSTRLSLCLCERIWDVDKEFKSLNQCYATRILECKRRKQFSQKSFYECNRRDERRSGVLKSRIEGCMCFSWGVTVKRFNWICEGEVWNTFQQTVAIVESDQNICRVLSWIWRFKKRKERHSCWSACDLSKSHSMVSENEKSSLWPGHHLLITCSSRGFLSFLAKLQ